jgi:hypothetical protein
MTQNTEEREELAQALYNAAHAHPVYTVIPWHGLANWVQEQWRKAADFVLARERTGRTR